MKKKAHAGRGFTLVELMFVLIIGATMVTLGVATYLSQVQQIRLQNDVREVNQTLQLARMRTFATGIPHGVIFLQAQKSYYVFVDCNNNDAFTDNDSNPLNNNPVNTAEACAASAYDPRMSGEGIHKLQDTDSFFALPGSEIYVVFNTLGQTVQGASPVFGDIIIRGPQKKGLVSEGIIHLSASGLSAVAPTRRVTY